MKAKEYYAKYRGRISSPDDKVSLHGIADLVFDLSMELKSLLEKRNIRTNRAAASVVVELNDKYNAVCRMFEKDYPVSPIKQDGFMTYWRRQIPEYDLYLKMKGM